MVRGKGCLQSPHMWTIMKQELKDTGLKTSPIQTWVGSLGPFVLASYCHCLHLFSHVYSKSIISDNLTYPFLLALASLSIFCWTNPLFPWGKSHSGVYRENKPPGDDRLGLIFKTRHMNLVHIISSNPKVGWSEHSASDIFLNQVNSERFLGSSMYL